jgi:hypothetical protein
MAQETREQYLKDFAGERQKEALKHALDIRKFEIDLYWKRAAYFWTFIAAAFAGYFVLQKEGDLASIYVVTCLGFLFSLAWYCVNRGSSAWQRNWECHVDLLEDEIMGPLHKSVINRRTYKLLHLIDPFPFSPSRINNILALTLVFVWAVFIVRTLLKARAFQAPYSGTIIATSVLTFVATAMILWKGQSLSTPQDPVSIERKVRKYM